MVRTCSCILYHRLKSSTGICMYVAHLTYLSSAEMATSRPHLPEAIRTSRAGGEGGELVSVCVCV